ncbi:MAG TPA: hypothetical protein VEJ87_01015 [Acidimicrobiales bacterium]|nr:hypothetical protein [Acidimicrobiales bacterium]
MVRHHRATDAAATLLTAVLSDPAGYDRVLRGKEDSLVGVMESSELTHDSRSADEVATPIHCFRRAVLAAALRRLRPAEATGEYALTGVYAVLHDAGYKLESLTVDDPMEAAGVNDRAQLAVAESELRYRINERWMRRGVTMWDPERTYVDAGSVLAPDVVILPGVVLQGRCTIESGAEIGPDCHLVDCVVGEGAVVSSTHARHVQIGARSVVGPFAVLERGSVVGDGDTVPPFSNFTA